MMNDQETRQWYKISICNIPPAYIILTCKGHRIFLTVNQDSQQYVHIIYPHNETVLMIFVFILYADDTERVALALFSFESPCCSMTSLPNIWTVLQRNVKMASSQDAWYLSLLGLAENFRTSSPPNFKLCIQCLQAVFNFKPPQRVEARTHLQLGNILLTHTKNIDLARNHLEKAVRWNKPAAVRKVSGGHLQDPL